MKSGPQAAPLLAELMTQLKLGVRICKLLFRRSKTWLFRTTMLIRMAKLKKKLTIPRADKG